MSDKCENKDAIHIDWILGEVHIAPCMEDATHIIVTGSGFTSLCDECAEDKIGRTNYPEDLGD